MIVFEINIPIFQFVSFDALIIAKIICCWCSLLLIISNCVRYSELIKLTTYREKKKIICHSHSLFFYLSLSHSLCPFVPLSFSLLELKTSWRKTDKSVFNNWGENFLFLSLYLIFFCCCHGKKVWFYEKPKKKTFFKK